MKILKLSIKNVNSLKGEFCIDFESFDEGIFAITGATGAGKSTILDSICASMYARTPRLKNISELMSKHTGDFYCESEFEIEGKRYKSRFSQRRANAKSDGKLQNPKMILSDDSGNIIEESVKKVPKAIEKITGLDFDRFTKSIVLAQGNFDAFLKANSKEKAELLEKITSSKIYSLISKRVYELHKEEKVKIGSLLNSIENIEVLKEEEKEELKSKIKELKDKKENLLKSIESLQKEINEAQKIKDILSQIEALEKEEEEILKLEEENEKKFKTLKKALKANKVINEWERYKEKDKKFKNIAKKIENFLKTDKISKERLEDILKEIKERIKALEKERENTKEIIKNLQKSKPKTIDLTSLFEEKERISKEESFLENIKRDLKDFQIIKEKLETLNKEKKIKEKELKETQDMLDIISKDINYEKAILEEKEKRKELGLKIISLEEERKRLKENEPCPLCGSKTHPWANKKNPNISKLEKEIKDIKQKIENLTKEYLKISKQKSSTKTTLQNLKNTIKDLENQKERLSKNIDSLNPEKIDEEIKKVQKLKDEIQKEIKKGELLNKEAKKTEERIISLEKESIQTKHLIKELENKIEKIEELKENFLKNKKELQKAKEDFYLKLKSQNFTDIEDFQKSILNQNEIEKIESKKNEIEKKKVQIEAKLNDKKNQIKDKSFKEEDFINKKREIKELEEERDEIIQTIASFKERLSNNEKNENKIKSIKEEIERKQKEFKTLDMLNTLIGSSDGGKYRKFASLITLDMLISIANHHLKSLNDRYTLKRGEKELDIEIIDGYQADIKRPIETLSGGESFIVSLSLALALSDLVSDKTKIGSLFLDEGFGTLDSETLEAVLSALNSLKNQGRIVGIISHLEALKDRINRQIKIIKLQGGVSRIEIV